MDRVVIFRSCHVPCRDGDGQTPASPWRKPFVGYIVEDNDIGRLSDMLRIRHERRHVLMLASYGQRVVSLIRLYGGPLLRVNLGAAQLDVFEKYAVVDYAGSGIKSH